MTHVSDRLERCLGDLIDGRKVFGATVSLSSKRQDFHWSGGAGNLGPRTPYFVASTTKLYITALVLSLRAEGLLTLDDPISRYLSDDWVAGLHVLKGRSSAHQVTLRHLLAHTSGIPDYFQVKRADGISLERRVTQGEDRSWSLEEAVADSKKLSPRFYPGTPGKAHYSDTGFQLLGRMIEAIAARPLAELLEGRIFKPLELKQTYMYSNPLDPTPIHLYCGNQPLHIPKAMASFWADGGLVSTAEESLRFLVAFFGGKFFPVEYLPELQHWNRIFFPLQAGVGILRFKLPRIFSPFKAMPELIGHSGLSGAFEFYCPEREVFLAGTVNQIQSPGTSFRLMLKLVEILESGGRS